MPLDRGQDIALDPPHAHAQRKQLERKGLAGAAGPKQVQVGVLIFLRIEQVHDAQRIVMPVNAQQYARVVRHLKTGKHIGGRRPTGQHVPLGLLFQGRGNLQKRHHGTQRRLLLEFAVTDIHIHGFEHIGNLLLAPHQLFIAFSRNRNEYRHVKQILVIVGNPMLDEIACLDGVCQLFVIGTGILHAFEFCPVQADTLRHLVNSLAPVLPAQMHVNVDPFTGIDQSRHPARTHHAGIAVAFDI